MGWVKIYLTSNKIQKKYTRSVQQNWKQTEGKRKKSMCQSIMVHLKSSNCKHKVENAKKKKKEYIPLVIYIDTYFNSTKTSTVTQLSAIAQYKELEQNAKPHQECKSDPS